MHTHLLLSSLALATLLCACSPPTQPTAPKSDSPAHEKAQDPTPTPPSKDAPAAEAPAAAGAPVKTTLKQHQHNHAPSTHPTPYDAKTFLPKLRDPKLQFLNNPANAQAFLKAAQETQDPTLLANAIDGLYRTWSANPKAPAKPHINGAWTDVILQGLQHTSPIVLDRAILASTHLLQADPHNPKALQLLTQHAQSHPQPAGRLRALLSLTRLPNAIQNPTTAPTFTKALQPNAEPFFLAMLLRRLRTLATPRITPPQDLVNAALTLTKHTNPSVQSAAMEWLSANATKLPKNATKTLRATLLEHLQHKHPNVVATAAKSLSYLSPPPPLEPIVNLLDDTRTSSHALPTWTWLDGSTDVFVHHPSSRDRVDHAALQSISKLSRRLPDKSIGYFTPPPIRPKSIDADMKTATTKARAWYKTAQSALKK